MASWLVYADDMQVYGSCGPANVVSFSTKLSRCVDETSGWMKSNGLQSNPDKAEVLWRATSRRQHQLPTTALLIDGPAVGPVTSVRDLRIYIDADLVMRTHVQRTVSRCFTALRQLHQIRRSVPPSTSHSLVVTGAIEAELWKRRAGRPSGRSTVGGGCSGMGDLPHEIRRSHH